MWESAQALPRPDIRNSMLSPRDRVDPTESMTAKAAVADEWRIQGRTGARFRGPLDGDDGLLRIQIYVASDTPGKGPTLVRGTTASLDGEFITFLPEAGGAELQVPCAEVFRHAKEEASHSEKQANKAAIAERKATRDARIAAAAQDASSAAAELDTRTACLICNLRPCTRVLGSFCAHLGASAGLKIAFPVPRGFFAA